MRLEVYSKEEEGLEKVVRLALRKVVDTVELIAVDTNGGRLSMGTIAEISLEHGIHLLGNVAADIGFPLHSTGHLKMY